MTFRFDFALSFARADRETARKMKDLLKSERFSVFFDEDFEHEMIGTDGSLYLRNVYARESRFCVVLISRQYDQRLWTQLERESIQSRELTGERGTLIPVKLENYDPEWLPATRIYFDLERRPINDLVSLLKRKARGEQFSAEDTEESRVDWGLADLGFRREKLRAHEECKAIGIDLDLHSVQLVMPFPLAIKNVKQILTDLLKKKVEIDVQAIAKTGRPDMMGSRKVMGRVESEYLDILGDFRLCLTNFGLSGPYTEDSLDEFKRHCEAIIRSVVLPGGVGYVKEERDDRD